LPGNGQKGRSAWYSHPKSAVPANRDRNAEPVTNVLPEHVISSLRERRKRMPKSDCQRERVSSALVMSQLNGSSQLLGIDLNDLRAKQAKERRIRLTAQVFKEWAELTDRLIKMAEPGDPDPAAHAIKYIEDKRGKRHG
jgi:hypothetical protein